MPIYAYRCQSCGFAKDALQKVSDPALTECPECHQPTFRKQLTAAGFQLKGTGWYVTDFRDGQKKPPATGVAPATAAASEAGAAGDAGSSTAGKSESSTSTSTSTTPATPASTSGDAAA
ncbi:FmdB family zinc ribbon protein [Lacisediminimonas sp.]|uniref:FmdB family zinc ribbon protein n=1 Tax=Lacisediminimonas sp. TaxID=3060582 RepID=UPI00271E372B|nr:FmdB family zinc ribbon protein [Lacisediminimonas sp.]MDO8298676.1 zinc ribbon domain-containing protein [Lacisediminimonas sp.]MDO9218891.1 zinc ribbon domain-containing protein [Lacisediminimonas sp.]